MGDAGGDALAGGQLGSAPGRTHIAGFGGTYTFSPRLLLDANFGYTHQKLGAEGPDLGTNFGLDVLHIPGTNGPDRMQSGMPSFQVNGWANMGNPNTGNPFQFDDKQYVWNANLSWFRGAHTIRIGLRLLESADQSLPAAGRHLPDRARHVPVQWQLDAAPELAGAD